MMKFNYLEDGTWVSTCGRYSYRSTGNVYEIFYDDKLIWRTETLAGEFCAMHKAAVDAGRDEGIDYDLGYANGYTSGYDVGYTAGYGAGQAAGYITRRRSSAAGGCGKD